jgi:hypothetical protein
MDGENRKSGYKMKVGHQLVGVGGEAVTDIWTALALISSENVTLQFLST